MKTRKTLYILIATVCLAGLLDLVSGDAFASKPPKFSEIECPKARKARFIQYFRKIIQAENEQILAKRAKVEALFVAYWAKNPPQSSDLAWLQALSEKYRLKNQDFRLPKAFQNLLIRMDALPEELILAQAGLESGWGTSRFAQEGHNYFGQWCFSLGCGMVPKNRADGHIHEVQTFESPLHSLRAYMRNLNSHPAYTSFRQARREMRRDNQAVSGIKLADELHLYATDQQYAQLLQGIMKGIKSTT